MTVSSGTEIILRSPGLRKTNIQLHKVGCISQRSSVTQVALYLLHLSKLIFIPNPLLVSKSTHQPNVSTDINLFLQIQAQWYQVPCNTTGILEMEILPTHKIQHTLICSQEHIL